MIVVGIIAIIDSLIFLEFKSLILGLALIGVACYWIHNIEESQKLKQKSQELKQPIQVTEIPKGFTLIDTIVETDTGRVNVIFMYKMQKVK